VIASLKATVGATAPSSRPSRSGTAPWPWLLRLRALWQALRPAFLTAAMTPTDEDIKRLRHGNWPPQSDAVRG
jgi:hypothetical protein